MSYIGIWFFRLLLALDQLANVLLLGFPDESISGRLGRAHMSGRPKWYAQYGKVLVDWIFSPFEKDHCVASVEFEDNFDKRFELWCWHYKNTKKS